MEDKYNSYNSDSNFDEVTKEEYNGLLSRFLSRKQLPKFETFVLPHGNSIVGDVRVESTNGYEIPSEAKGNTKTHVTNWHLGDNSDLRYVTVLFREVWDSNDMNVETFLISKQTKEQLSLYEQYMEKL